jgi:hypothetical protein
VKAVSAIDSLTPKETNQISQVMLSVTEDIVNNDKLGLETQLIIKTLASIDNLIEPTSSSDKNTFTPIEPDTFQYLGSAISNIQSLSEGNEDSDV